jgi:hypothetical protein
MSEPNVAEQIWGLAKLGEKPEKVEVPGTSIKRDLLMLKLIAEAQARGVSWANIGRVLVGRPDGKLAKKAARRLARDTQRELLRTGMEF